MAANGRHVHHVIWSRENNRIGHQHVCYRINKFFWWLNKKKFVTPYCRVKQSPPFCQQINKQANKQTNTATVVLDYKWSPFSLRNSGVSETRARVKITSREKGETRWGERTLTAALAISPFSRGVIFTRARVSLALLSLRKNWDYS